MAPRYAHIDIAKGFGILLIVLGHNYVVAPSKGAVWAALYSFHVPLFFFLSGLFISPGCGLRKHIIKKLDSYLKPYFVTLIIVGIAIVPFEVGPVSNYLGKMLCGVGPGLPKEWVPLWFLPHLFAVSVLTHLCGIGVDLFSRSKIVKFLFLSTILWLGLFGIWSIKKSSLWGISITIPLLPFSLDIALLNSFYFLLGSVFKNEVLNLKVNWKFLLLSITVFAFIQLKFGYTMDLNVRRYDDSLICTVGAFLGIYIAISISRLVQDTPLVSKFLAYLGSNTLFILLFHNFIQMKTIMVLKASLQGNKYIILPLIALVSFSLALMVPVFLHEAAKRNFVLRVLLLPHKSVRGLQAATAGPANGSYDPGPSIVSALQHKS